MMDGFQKKQMLAGISDLTETVCLWYSDVPQRLQDIVLLLSQQGFPHATRVVLNWLGEYFDHCKNYPTGKFPNKHQVLFLIDSFVFFKTDQVQVQLTLSRELHLLEEICKHFRGHTSQASKYLTFEALFGGRSNPSDNVEEHRQKILHKVVSLALSLQWSEVLECAAVWLHSQNLSPSAIGLTESILLDFCDLLPNASGALQKLSDVCPQFLNQLLPPVFSLFCDKGYKDEHFPPSLSVFVKIAAEWLSKEPSLCLRHVISPLKQNATFHKITMKEKTHPPTGPVGHLLLFCILHPLWTLRSPTETGREDSLTVSKLFFYIIQAVMMFPRVQQEADRVYIISRHDINTITAEIKRTLRHVDPSASEVELSLDRLAEAIQIGNASKQLEMTLEEMEDICEEMPQCRLLDIVLRTASEEHPTTSRVMQEVVM